MQPFVYRYRVLGGDVGECCRELLRGIVISQEMMIYAGSINRDHVHRLISISSQLSVSRAVQYLGSSAEFVGNSGVATSEEPIF